MKITKVILWYRYYKGSKTVGYNHYENGWLDIDTPTPHCKEQKTDWVKSKWGKQYGLFIKILGRRILIALY